MHPTKSVETPNFAYFTMLDPDAIAVTEPSGKGWSRSRLSDLSNQIAHAFAGADLRRGDAVAILAPNCAEYLAVYLAGVSLGLYVVPINWHLATAEIAYILQSCHAKAVICHDRLGSARLNDVASSQPSDSLLIIVGEGDGFVSLEDFVTGQPRTPVDTPPIGRVMAYTSATTGRPKGVRLPLRNAQNALKRIIQWHQSLGIDTADNNVHLCSSMLYHSAPLEGSIVALHMGHHVVLVDHWHPELLLQLIDRYNTTTTFMVPAMFVRLLKLPLSTRNRYSTASLRFVVHAGAPCPVEVKQAMLEWWGPIIWESYGAAEGQGAIASPKDWLKFPGTVGRPFPGSRFKITDDAGKQLDAGEVGTIYFTPHTGDTFEYVDSPTETRAAYLGEFITVGDLGYMNSDGYVFLCGRKSELIISSGMNIYPTEIEQVLLRHPAIVDCAVFGVRHDLVGEVPHAVVQVADGVDVSSSLTAEIMEFLNKNLSAMKMPRRIEYLKKLPRDPNGKLFKRLLYAPAAAR